MYGPFPMETGRTGTSSEQRFDAGAAPTALARPFFVDHSRQKIDEKGRLILPASYRSAFVGGGYVTYWSTATLALLTEAEHEARYRRLRRSLRAGRPGAETLVPSEALRAATVLTQAFQPDAQGRFVLKSELRERAGIDSEVEFVGAGRRVEIVPADRFSISTAGLEFVEMMDENHDLLDDEDGEL